MRSSTRVEPKDSDPKFTRKDGKLTSYAFSCGYIEESETGLARITLSRENGSSPYHVKVFDCIEYRRVIWECFETVAEARKFFNQ